MDIDTLFGMIEKMVLPMFKHAVPRIGKVLNTNDPNKQGKILVSVPSLGWNTEDTGAWCFPTDKKSLVIPEKDDWVLVEWIDGNPDLPVYRGIPTNIKEQIPEGYDGDPETNILFQGSSDDIMKYKNGVLEILMQELLLGNNASLGVARLSDAVQVTIPAGTFLISADNGVPNPAPVVVDGEITGSSDTVKAGD